MTIRAAALVFTLALAACTSRPTANEGSTTPATDRILFTRGGDIYGIDPDGQRLRRITSSPGKECCAVASPDGRQIAFVRDTDPREPSPGIDFGPSYQRFDIFVMESDGSSQRQLTHDAATESFLAWSPDGERIGYSRSLIGEPMDIWEIVVATGSRSRLTDGTGDSYAPSWSPDGTKIAFDSTYRPAAQGVVYLMEADGSNERPIIQGGDVGAVHPLWSPNGRWILFGFGDYTQFDLYLADPEGELRNRLTHTAVSEVGGSWSPDGHDVVYQSGGDLFILKTQSGEVRRLTSGNSFDYAPSWAPLTRP